MSESVVKINKFFKSASRADVDKILSKIILSDRQDKILKMYYLQRHDLGFIADTLNSSYSVIKTELKAIRQKLKMV